MDVELGLIEGFYGKCWSWDEREDQARFLADAGYRFYVYAPKADPYLRRRWRDDYPKDEADRLARLAGVCAAAGLSFGVGFSPFEVYRGFDSEAKAALARKLAFFDAAGVAELSILFDDMRADTPDIAATQGRIVTWMAERTAARRIVVCPSIYTDDAALVRSYGAAPPTYLEDLAQRLDPAIGLYWTGEEVCSREYSAGHLRRIGERMGRKPTLWDNYPVNDGPGMSPYLYLRAFTGRPASIAPHLAAHAVNPSLQPTLFRIPALTLVESYRAGDAYEYARAFERAADAVLGPDLGALVRRHFRSFHDLGLDRLQTEIPRLRERYAGIDHPGAREIVAWLDGAYRITREAVEAQ
ncbi:MAG TPA: beta-N-acetylglucosaminidase domain-containing protein [Caulobacteraceae bacterium]|nr:beta-N-acetylglucosaminidase domain-containing protein [Caulobacteraceae bacterium]